MKDENRVLISGKINTDLKVTKYKDKESGKELLFVGFQLESEKKQVTKREQINNYIWINAYQDIAEYCNEYLSKGRHILVEGTLESESWYDVKKGIHYKWFVKANKITCINDTQQLANDTWSTSNISVSGLATAEFRTESEQ